jgi:thioredoxin-related protein
MLLLVGLSSTFTVYSQGIQFENQLTWIAIKEKAYREKKYILIDLKATWCAPCNAMDKDVFPDETLGSFINDKYISLQVQTDQTKKDNDHIKSWYADAIQMMREFKITGYPTLLFLNSKAELVHRIVGYRDAKALLSDARDALDPKKQFYSKMIDFRQGNRETAFCKELTYQAQELGEKDAANEVAQVYINSLSENELFDKKNLTFIKNFTTKFGDRGYSLFMKESNKVDQLLGINTSAKSVRTVIENEEVLPYIEKVNKPNWEAIENRVSKYGLLGKEAYYGARMIYHWDKKDDWESFGKYFALYFATAYSRSKFHINNISWTVFEQVKDSKVLAVAAKTMKYDIEHFDKNDPGSYDTYANLLYKADKKQEAILWEEKAVRLEEENALKNSGKPNPVFAETLEKMKKG